MTRELLPSKHAEERRDDLRVELRAGAPQQFRDRLCRVEARAIGSILRHRIVRVDDADDAAAGEIASRASFSG